ncbi:lantibiotic dehydratase C-terminal domain-containing protein [Pedobacter psychroterrae]|uniref:Thiopeptide-type bacteriocin biosynthesis domain-containing protein n=1 Tax=Pedobacter psychroterrae TaxID=2530453 RepID=A0A4R0NKG5_9SPHI|nr:lantibiotic dehydratase C-terminal domain-containing protein [Pedobacter psychroterrae]TCD01260.1 hypothetical protein EZ437_10925 [Pedobacter psychroterrae]
MNARSHKFSFSIFYSIPNWHNLLLECLFPALEDKLDCIPDSKFFIHFSSEQGHHIRLSIFCHPKCVDAIKKDLQNIFTNFIESRPSVKPEVKFPLDSFLMDFKNNSVYSNVYRPYPSSTSLLSNDFLLELRFEISLKIKELLCVSEIEQDSVLSFGIELQCLMATALYQEKAKNLFSDLTRVISILESGFQHSDILLIHKQANAIITDNIEHLNSLSETMSLSLTNDPLYNLVTKHSTQHGNTQAIFLQLSSILFEHLDLQKNYFLLVSTNIVLHTLRPSKSIIYN